jgi:hypothetical protein
MSLHAVWARHALWAVVCLVTVLPKLAFATDPTSPTELLETGVGFRFQIALQVPPSSVAVRSIYNRIAGSVVNAGADAVQGVPVVRPLAIQQDAQGRYVIDAAPSGPGQPPLPNGIYSLWIETQFTPGPEMRARARFRQRRNVYFRVIDGTVQRLTLAGYSALVDPIGQRKNKLGELEPVHQGAAALKLSSSQSAPLELVESGEPYSTPDNSEQGQ